MSVSVYKFVDYSEFFKAIFLFPSKPQWPKSLSGWARLLGYGSPQSVSMVISKERIPSRDMLSRVSAAVGLSHKEFHYLQLLVDLERCKKSKKDIRPVLAQLQKINPHFSEYVGIDAKKFSYIAEWYYLPLRQLIALPDFVEDVHWIRKRLRRKLSEANILKALKNLEDLDLIERDAQGKLKLKVPAIETTTDIPSPAIKEHHKQMLGRAQEAIDEQTVQQREFINCTFRFSRDRMQEAKETLRAFCDHFEKTYGADAGEEVVQFGMYFFSHTN